MNASSSPLSLSSAGWYCLRVLTRREHITARNLEQRTGVQVFAPRIAVQNGPEALRSEPLFPGYLFARFRYPQEVRHVASTPGVVGLVTFGGPPPLVADHVIEHLGTEVQRAAASAPDLRFAAGDWVRIVAGCFHGSEGRVVEAGGSAARVCVLLTLLGQQIEISIPRRQLAGADAIATNFPAGLRSGPALPSILR